MFARVSALLLAVPLLVAATAVHRGGGPVVDQCNTGSIQCCDSLQHASSVDPTSNLGLLAGVLSGLTGQIGSGCIDIPIIGAKNGW
ncbi:hypothetical protein AX14_001278 [Amanita brunnescens Koide BX004]|nr:hypothetical protein AX14_001278 [Amanita brunnescens Koide BX004]